PRPWCPFARRRPTRSRARRSRSRAGKCDATAHHAARRGDQGRGAAARPQGGAAPVAAAVRLQGGDRERGPPAATRQLRRHAAAFRPDVAALSRAEGDDAGRAVATHDGVERQRHRPGRPAARAGAGQPPAIAEGWARAAREPDRRGAPLLPRHGARERRLDRRHARRPFRRRHRDPDAAPGQDQGVGAQGYRQRSAAMSAANPVTLPLANYEARFMRLAVEAKDATITLDRPDKKNPLTYESSAEIAELCRADTREKAVKAFVITGAGGTFCSGGDVFEIIKPLIEMEAAQLLDFTRMTGEVVKAMRACPQPIVAAVDGVCAGAGAILAMGCDMRLGTPKAKVAFLFNRVGLAGCDMGACAILPRLIGAGRAAELLYTGRVLGGEEAERWGFFNRLATPDTVLAQAQQLAAELAAGPAFANAMTKRMLDMEWAMSVE